MQIDGDNNNDSIRTESAQPSRASANGYEDKLRQMLKAAHVLDDEALVKRNTAQRRSEFETALRHQREHDALRAFISAFLSS